MRTWELGLGRHNKVILQKPVCYGYNAFRLGCKTFVERNEAEVSLTERRTEQSAL